MREFKYGADTHEGGATGQGKQTGPDRDGANDDHDPSDRNRSRSGGGGGGRMTLPSEYADFILADGRRLEDVLGKSFFKGFGKDDRHGKRGKRGKRARMLAERQAQAKRLNQTRSILTGARGVAGAANTAKGRLSGG
ncbi:MAG: hypothetical protein IMF05_14055 [Proteobacteria bacterium]|nr:hypothetical protein [Pseudomonadota bacterium]